MAKKRNKVKEVEAIESAPKIVEPTPEEVVENIPEPVQPIHDEEQLDNARIDNMEVPNSETAIETETPQSADARAYGDEALQNEWTKGAEGTPLTDEQVAKQIVDAANEGNAEVIETDPSNAPEEGEKPLTMADFLAEREREYNDYIKAKEDEMKAYSQESKDLERRNRLYGLFGGLADVASSFANLWGTTKGAAPMKWETPQRHYVERLDAIKMKRDRRLEKFEAQLDTLRKRKDALDSAKMAYFQRMDAAKLAHANRMEEINARTDARMTELEAKAENRINEIVLKGALDKERTDSTNASREKVASIQSNARQKAAETSAKSRVTVAETRNSGGGRGTNLKLAVARMAQADLKDWIRKQKRYPKDEEIEAKIEESIGIWADELGVDMGKPETPAETKSSKAERFNSL